MDEIDRQILETHSRRMYRMGGFELALWVITVVALACGAVPLLPLILLGKWSLSPHLPALPFTPLIIDMGVLVSVLLADAFSRHWAPRHWRYAVIVAVLTAVVLRTALYITSVGFSDELMAWQTGHLISTGLLTWMVIRITSVCAWPPLLAKSRSARLDIPGHAHRDRPLVEPATDYKLPTMSQERCSCPSSEQAA